MQPILLDTCALIWINENQSIAPSALTFLKEAGAMGAITYVSPISAWELGLLVSRERIRLLITPERWFQRTLEAPRVELAAMSPEVLIGSSFLPGTPPRDPADRIIAATARYYGCTLITRDRKLLDYGAQGHIRTMAC